MLNTRTLSVIFVWITLTYAMGCAPKYPRCDKDAQCKTGEFCVNRQCQQCRTSNDCAEGAVCNHGRCETEPACTSDAMCGPGMVCQNGHCVAQKRQCEIDDDCPEGHECHNGKCIAPPRFEGKASCVMDPLYFKFDDHTLTQETMQRLKTQIYTCLKKESLRSVIVEGHCDPRGTTEYNLALGDRRSQSVITYLQRLGVEVRRLKKSSKGALEANGSNEAGWAKDRKVIFIWE